VRSQGLIAKGEVRRLARLWVLFVAVAAAVDVPFAITRIRPLTTRRPPERLHLSTNATSRDWPSSTPEFENWPAPNDWWEWRRFAYHEYLIRKIDGSTIEFVMVLQHLGWPLPVLEQKDMFRGSEATPSKERVPDLRFRLLWAGLVLNPLIVGTGALIALGGPWIGFVVLRRAWRRHGGQCLACGYFIRTGSAKCPECGAAIVGAAIANSAETSGEKAEASVGTGE